MQESQQQQAQRTSKVAPWGQSVASVNVGTSLAEIQRIEREKRAEQVVMQQKALQALKEKEEREQSQEKSIQLGWALKKTMPPKKIKTLAEIQQEEQEKLAKQMAEQRLAQQLKEKEVTISTPSVGIWGAASQSLTWSNNQQQWSSNQNTGNYYHF